LLLFRLNDWLAFTEVWTNLDERALPIDKFSTAELESTRLEQSAMASIVSELKVIVSSAN